MNNSPSPGSGPCFIGLPGFLGSSWLFFRNAAERTKFTPELSPSTKCLGRAWVGTSRFSLICSKKEQENWKRFELLTIFAEPAKAGPKQFSPVSVSDSCRYPVGKKSKTLVRYPHRPRPLQALHTAPLVSYNSIIELRIGIEQLLFLQKCVLGGRFFPSKKSGCNFCYNKSLKRHLDYSSRTWGESVSFC